MAPGPVAYVGENAERAFGIIIALWVGLLVAAINPLVRAFHLCELSAADHTTIWGFFAATAIGLGWGLSVVLARTIKRLQSFCAIGTWRLRRELSYLLLGLLTGAVAVLALVSLSAPRHQYPASVDLILAERGFLLPNEVEVLDRETRLNIIHRLLDTKDQSTLSISDLLRQLIQDDLELRKNVYDRYCAPPRPASPANEPLGTDGYQRACDLLSDELAPNRRYRRVGPLFDTPAIATFTYEAVQQHPPPRSGELLRLWHLLTAKERELAGNFLSEWITTDGLDWELCDWLPRVVNQDQRSKLSIGVRGRILEGALDSFSSHIFSCLAPEDWRSLIGHIGVHNRRSLHNGAEWAWRYASLLRSGPKTREDALYAVERGIASIREINHSSGRSLANAVQQMADNYSLPLVELLRDARANEAFFCSTLFSSEALWNQHSGLEQRDLIRSLRTCLSGLSPYHASVLTENLLILLSTSEPPVIAEGLSVVEGNVFSRERGLPDYGHLLRMMRRLRHLPMGADHAKVFLDDLSVLKTEQAARPVVHEQSWFDWEFMNQEAALRCHLRAALSDDPPDVLCVCRELSAQGGTWWESPECLLAINEHWSLAGRSWFHENLDALQVQRRCDAVRSIWDSDPIGGSLQSAISDLLPLIARQCGTHTGRWLGELLSKTRDGECESALWKLRGMVADLPPTEFSLLGLELARSATCWSEFCDLHNERICDDLTFRLDRSAAIGWLELSLHAREMPECVVKQSLRELDLRQGSVQVENDYSPDGMITSYLLMSDKDAFPRLLDDLQNVWPRLPAAQKAVLLGRIRELVAPDGSSVPPGICNSLLHVDFETDEDSRELEADLVNRCGFAFLETGDAFSSRQGWENVLVNRHSRASTHLLTRAVSSGLLCPDAEEDVLTVLERRYDEPMWSRWDLMVDQRQRNSVVYRILRIWSGHTSGGIERFKTYP